VLTRVVNTKASSGHAKASTQIDGNTMLLLPFSHPNIAKLKGKNAFRPSRMNWS
jgi:hypothetical protein